MSNLINLPPLFKRTANGGIQTWSIAVHPEDDGTATIITTHGLLDGAKQNSRDHIKQGKNPGKKNETTAQQQAVKEAEAKHTKKQERELYGLTVEQSDMKKRVAPMLAHTYEDHETKVDWSDKSQPKHIQPKFDGHRCLAFKTQDGVTLFSRKAVEITSCPHVVEELSRVMMTGDVFDGELYIHGTPLNKISSLIRREQEGSQYLRYMMYDMMNPSPFLTRYHMLENRITSNSGFGDNIDLARTNTVTDLDDALQFQQDAIANDYEGAMLRWGSVGYEPGKRSHSLLKMKTFIDGEFTIVGAKVGRGTFAGMAVFVCVTDDGNPFDVTAPGTHEDKKQAWVDREKYIGRKMTVKYQNMSATEAPVPIFPVAKGFVEE